AVADGGQVDVAGEAWAGVLRWDGRAAVPYMSAPWGAGWSGAQQGFDGAAFVHRAVALGGLVQGQGEVEDPARVDLAVPDQIDQFGQEAADRGGAAVQVDVGEEQLLAGQLDVVGDADVADA